MTQYFSVPISSLLYKYDSLPEANTSVDGSKDSYQRPDSAIIGGLDSCTISEKTKLQGQYPGLGVGLVA